MPRISVATGIDIYYEEYGAGEPLLLIMGTGVDHAGWTLHIDHYAAEYRCIVFDNRGVGQSSKPPADDAYSTGIMADDAAALMEALGVAKAHVSGVSLGSAIAQQLALRHPDKVATLQLHGTWARSDEWIQRSCDLRRTLLRHLPPKETSRLTRIFTISPEFFRDRPYVVQMMEDMQPDEADGPTVAGLKGQWWADRCPHTIDRLPNIRVPTLVTAGERDMCVPVRYSEEVALAIPDAEFHLFRNSTGSHAPLLEDPPAFTELTLDFLRRHPLS